MFLETAGNVCLVILLSLADVLSQNGWYVSYPLRSICMTTGNSVDIPCWYRSPAGHKVNRTFWYKDWVTGDIDPKDLADDPEYSNRVEYLGDKNQKCNFRIKQLKREDSAEYQFRFITESSERYAGMPGVKLFVTEVAAKQEPDFTLTLTCNTGCPHGDVTYAWYKNGHQLQGEYLDNIYIHYKEDTKNYSCTFQDRKGSSLEESIKVNYTMIVNPRGEIAEGNSVILICRSNSRNAETSYKWYKKNGNDRHEMKSSKTLIIKDIKPEHSGHYFCRLWTTDSPVVYINVQYAPKNISVRAFPSLNVKERDSVTLTCGSKANPEVQTYTWFKKNGEKIIKLGSRNNYTITNITSKDSGPYFCLGENKHGAINSTYLSVNVQYAPRNLCVSVSPTGGIVMGDSVALTCSSDANPPAKSYQWFKDEILISSGASGQNYTINNIKSEHNGRYNCSATNDVGSHSSPAVFIFVQRETAAVIGATVGIAALVVLVVMVTLVWKISKHSQCKKDTRGGMQREDTANPVYANISGMASNDTEIQEESLYSTAQQDKSRDREQVQYMSIYEPCDPNVDEVQYSTVQFLPSKVTSGTPVRMLTDASAIYSTVSKP
ncbi:B-cell receptor CD22-like isoform X2 [Brienomyrus brachyistius]|nr:B-cell receptor CD22-like isoform X2 [Brienomyrus brachyistius]